MFRSAAFPAPGYPACPEHTVKRDMFETMACQDVGMELIDSLAMYPAAAVSGFYFSHPESQYFNVGIFGAMRASRPARPGV